MTKFKMDMTKGLYDQSWWNLLKPEVKLKAIKHWKDTDKIVDEKISNGEIKIDPTIPLRNMCVDIPTTDLIKFTNLNKPIPTNKEKTYGKSK
jgi:hypothetical protein